MSDEFDLASSPEFKAFAADVNAHLLPKLVATDATISLLPTGETDVKFAVELGMSIMLDKPIIAVVQPGTNVPERIRRVADAVIEADLSDPAAAEGVQRAIYEVLDGLENAGVISRE